MSVTPTGLLSVFGVAPETVYGTKVTPCTYFQDVLSNDLAGNSNVLTPWTCNGKRGLMWALQGPYTTLGGIKMLFQPSPILGLFLKSLMGAVVTTDLGGGAYQHVFTPLANSDLPSLTAYVDKIRAQFLYPGFKVGEMTFNMPYGKEAEIDVSGVAQKSEITTTQVSTLPTQQPLSWAHATISVNSSANIDVENAVIKVNNDIEPVGTLNGSRFIQYIVAKLFHVDVDFTIGYVDNAMLLKLWGNVAATEPTFTVYTNTITLKMESAEEIASSGEFYTVQFDIPNATITGDEPKVDGPGNRIMQPNKFIGRIASNGDMPLTITLINDIASY